jgi:arylsulfatase A-like enzyme
MAKLSRRDFLKIAGAAAAGAFVSQKAHSLSLRNEAPPNIILFVMDALSARHLSLYGYPRATTPNIDAFAARSTVYHNHYTAGNFTTPGVASMLTGMLPWKHGAFIGGGLVRPKFVNTNPFTLLGSDYYRFAFSQNTWADYLISQHERDIERFLSPFTFGLAGNNISQFFQNDRAVASMAFNDLLFSMEGTDSPAGSSIFGYLYKSHALNLAEDQKSTRYPKGSPEVMSGIPYYNEDVYYGVSSEIANLESRGNPYFAYFHLYSPHFPYRPKAEYRKLFHDDFAPAAKPANPILPQGLSEDYLLTQRVLYDRQIAQVDHEFGKLISQLDKDGVLDHSYLLFTSDHGELFERGFIGHGDLFLYEGALRVPLLIHAPRQTEHSDIFSLTSNIDILPTLLSIAGKGPAPDVDGIVLPGFGGSEEPDRPIFSIYAYDNSSFAPITKAVISMRKRTHKIIAYLGFAPQQVFELYDLENDPEERNNLASTDTQLLTAMKDELFAHLNEANRMLANPSI